MEGRRLVGRDDRRAVGQGAVEVAELAPPPRVVEAAYAAAAGDAAGEAVGAVAQRGAVLGIKRHSCGIERHRRIIDVELLHGRQRPMADAPPV